jgi:hypothetical protein
MALLNYSPRTESNTLANSKSAKAFALKMMVSIHVDFETLDNPVWLSGRCGGESSKSEEFRNQDSVFTEPA